MLIISIHDFYLKMLKLLHNMISNDYLENIKFKFSSVKLQYSFSQCHCCTFYKITLSVESITSLLDNCIFQCFFFYKNIYFSKNRETHYVIILWKIYVNNNKSKIKYHCNQIVWFINKYKTQTSQTDLKHLIQYLVKKE